MTLTEATQLYNDHAKRVGLGSEWRLEWMKRITNFRSAGSCSYKQKTIKLQPVYVEHNTFETVNNTILHEIAHALTPKQHHNNIWKRKAIEIGCNGKRCYGAEVQRPEKLPRFLQEYKDRMMTPEAIEKQLEQYKKTI
jgi:predicted SprT family Zn-dependent metalloprotease